MQPKHIKAFYLIFFSLAALICQGQLTENYTAGFVELKNAEKHEGLIRNDETGQMNYRVYFKSSKDVKTPVVYDTSVVQRVVLASGVVYDYFRFKPLYAKNSISVLGKCLLKGKASLYEVYYRSDVIFVVIADGKTYALQADKLESGAMEIQKYFFKRTLALALNDESFNAGIEAMSFDEKKIINILSEYNKKNNSESVIAGGKKMISYFVFTDIGGMYKNNNEREFFVQAIYRIYFPQLSKSTSLNLGASIYFTRYNYSYIFTDEKIPLKSTLFSIPFQIQQNILNKAVRPYIFAGFNLSLVETKSLQGVNVTDPGFQKNFGIGALAGVGIEADILKNFRVKSEYRYEVFSHLVSVGIGYYLLRR